MKKRARLKKEKYLNQKNKIYKTNFYESAIALYNKGELDHSIELLEQYQENNGYSKTKHVLGELCFQKAFHGFTTNGTPDYVFMSQYLKKALKNNPTKLNYLIWSGHCSIAQSKYGESESFFNRALKLVPNDDKIQSYLSYLHFIKEDYDKVSQLLKNDVSLKTPIHKLLSKLVSKKTKSTPSKKDEICIIQKYSDYTGYKVLLIDEKKSLGSISFEESKKYYHLGLLFSANKDFSKALLYFNEAIKNGHVEAKAKREKLYIQMGVFFAQKGKYRASLKYFNLVEDKSSIIMTYNLALSYEKTGDRSKAIEYWRKASRNKKINDETLTQIYLKIAENYFEIEKIGDGFRYMDRAASLTPTDKLHAKYGSLLEKYGREEEACYQYKYSLKINPNNIEVIMSLCYCLDYAEQSSECVPFLKKALELGSENPDIPDILSRGLYSQANMFIDKKMFDEALSFIEEGKSVQKIHVSDYDHHKYIGDILLIRILLFKKLTDKADLEIKKLEKMNRKKPYLYICLTKCLYEFDEIRALKMADKGLRCSKKNPVIAQILGDILDENGNELKSRAYFDKAIKWSDSPGMTAYEIGASREGDQRMYYLEKAHKILPENEMISCQLCHTYMDNGFFNQAESLLKKELKITSEEDLNYRDKQNLLKYVQSIIKNPTEYQNIIND